MRIHRFDHKPRPLEWLPDTHGFVFIGVKRDDTQVECTIERRRDGCRIIGAERHELKGWKPRPIGARSAV